MPAQVETRSPAPGQPPDRARRFAFVALCLGFFVAILDTTIVNVALPAIGTSLRTTTAGLQWTVNGYNLVFAALLLTCGALSDQWGGKKSFAAGLTVFLIGSALCGAAPGLSVLIAGRCIQGLGAALLMPASLTMIAHTYPEPARRTRAVAAWATVAGAATAAGPVIGGLLVDTIGWRAVFYVNLPVGVVALVLLSRFASETVTRRRGLDLAGQLLGVVALTSLALALTQAGSSGWASRDVVELAIVFGVSAVVFVATEAGARTPMLPPSLIRHRTFSAASLVGLVLNLGIYGQVFVLSLYFQHVRSASALTTGVLLLPFAAMTFLFPPLTGRATARFGPRPVMIVGQLLAAAGTAVLATATPSTPYGLLAPGLVMVGLGMAATMPSLTAAVMLAAPTEHAGIASGVLNASRQVGGVIGVALLGTLVAERNFTAGMHTALTVVALVFVLGAALAALTARAEAPNRQRDRTSPAGPENAVPQTAPASLSPATTATPAESR